MKKINLKRISGAIAFLFVLSMLAIGGCDVDFGSSDNGGGGGGGGGGGSDDPEIVQGTITDIIPDQDIDGIEVVIQSEDNLEFSDVTSSSGFFSISSLSGTFAGSPNIEFFDQSSNLLGITTITVFPTATVDLGNITLENGTIVFAETTTVTFKGDVITNNCAGNSGSIEVEASREGESTDVIVQVSASTDIVRDGDEILCENVLIGQNVEVRGDLTGSTVDAEFIDLL